MNAVEALGKTLFLVPIFVAVELKSRAGAREKKSRTPSALASECSSRERRLRSARSSSAERSSVADSRTRFAAIKIVGTTTSVAPSFLSIPLMAARFQNGHEHKSSVQYCGVCARCHAYARVHGRRASELFGCNGIIISI